MSQADGTGKLLGLPQELTVQQELACALRILAHEGWQEYLSGHITWVEPGEENLWCNPWGIWWEETCARDIVQVTPDGEHVSGEWEATGAVFIHTELHRARPDAVVVVHGHPYYATLLAGLGIAPEIIHQNSCIFDGDIGYVDEYDGKVVNSTAGAALAEHIGKATGIILANHGAIVTGSTIQEACYKSVMFERMCRFYYDSLLTGLPIKQIDAATRANMKGPLTTGCPPVFWHGAVRQLLRREPEVLS